MGFLGAAPVLGARHAESVRPAAVRRLLARRDHRRCVRQGGDRARPCAALGRGGHPRIWDARQLRDQFRPAVRAAGAHRYVRDGAGRGRLQPAERLGAVDRGVPRAHRCLEARRHDADRRRRRAPVAGSRMTALDVALYLASALLTAAGLTWIKLQLAVNGLPDAPLVWAAAVQLAARAGVYLAGMVLWLAGLGANQMSVAYPIGIGLSLAATTLGAMPVLGEP